MLENRLTNFWSIPIKGKSTMLYNGGLTALLAGMSALDYAFGSNTVGTIEAIPAVAMAYQTYRNVRYHENGIGSYLTIAPALAVAAGIQIYDGATILPVDSQDMLSNSIDGILKASYAAIGLFAWYGYLTVSDNIVTNTAGKIVSRIKRKKQ